MIHKGHSKINSSPIVRRVRKITPKLPLLPNNNMRKSISMDSMPLVNNRSESISKVLDNCRKFLEEKIDERTDHEQEESAEAAETDKVQHTESSSQELEVITHFDEVATHKDVDFSASLGSIPPPQLSRSRNISRSIVPKMRKMFEKARSADPEYIPQLKISLIPEQNKNGGVSRSPVCPSDGTESARSSFVMLTPSETTRSPTGSTTTLSEDSEGRLSREESKRKPGFVNKCVTKVRSLMGKSQERE